MACGNDASAEEDGVKLLVVITGMAYGGAETQTKHIILKLAQRGWDVRLVSMLPPKAYQHDFERAGVPIDVLEMRRRIPDPRAILRLAGIVRRERPHIVHAHMVHANLLARVTRAVSLMPILINTIHSTHEGSHWRTFAYRLTDRWCDLTTHVSRVGLELDIQRGKVPPHKIVHIPNGIETSVFKPDPAVRARMREALQIEDATFTWITVGRLETPKDYPNLLEAFRRLQQQTRIRTQLVIVGDGTLRSVAEQIIQRNNLQSSVRLLGRRTDIPNLLNAADAFVLASAWEGMPNAVLEAAATALPVVSTCVGDVPHIIRDSVFGYLVPPRNSEALAQAMHRLMLLDPRERQRMGSAARQHMMDNYELEVAVDRWEALYKQMIESHRKQLPQE